LVNKPGQDIVPMNNENLFELLSGQGWKF